MVIAAMKLKDTPGKESYDQPRQHIKKKRNNSRKNEEMEPKQKQHQVVDVTGDRSKV